MTNQKTKAIVFIQWFGMAVLAFTFIRSLLSPITSVIYSVINLTVSAASPDSLPVFFGELKTYSQLYLEQFVFTNDFLVRLLGNVVTSVLSLLPFATVLVYLFALYRKKRHSLLLPVAFVASAGWSALGICVYLHALVSLYIHISPLYDNSLLDSLRHIFLYQPTIIRSMMTQYLWLGVCVVLVIDCFTKFRLRGLSIATIIAYISICLLAPIIDLLFPLVTGFLLACMEQPIVKVFSDGLLVLLQGLSEMNLPALMELLFHMLNRLIPPLLGLMIPITYLLFWICGAKRLPQEKAAEATAEEITEEAAEVTADKEEIMSHPIYLIASDLHGSAYYTDELVDAFHREGADRLLLLGDILYHGPRNALPMGYDPKKVIDLLNPLADKITCVRGNCDSEVDQMVLNFPLMADYDTLMVEEQRLVLTHGHLFDTPKAPPVQAGDIVLQGHTHVPLCEHQPGGWWLLNPGSVSIPKEDSPHSYLLLKNGTFYWKSLLGETYRTAPLFE